MPEVCIRCGGNGGGAGRFCPYCGQVRRQLTSTSTRDPFVGRMIAGRYEVGELISIGGMGRVHRGLQRSLDRPVAIKFIHPHLLTTPNAVNRFMLEARAASRLVHPNVVSVFDFGRTDDDAGGDLYMVMELLSGFDLAKLLEREGPPPVPRIVEILRQVLLALGAAHARGITHRDVKPENIVLERLHGDVDHVKVIDFGIASMTGNERITSAGQVIGTPVYMAPEQVTGGAVGPSSDLYALGVILFELLTGRVPFDDPVSHRVMTMQLSAPRPDPRVVAPSREIPDAIAEVCMRAMAVNVADRYADAASLANAMSAAVGLMPLSTSRAFLLPRRTSNVRADAQTVPHEAAGVLDGVSIVGRDEELLSAHRMASNADARGIVWWGVPGAGRSRLLEECGAVLERAGHLVVRTSAEPHPWNEIGFGFVRRAIAALAAPSGSASAAVPEHGPDAEALQWIASVEAPAPASGAVEAAARALGWAFNAGTARARGRTRILTIDDVDRIDPPSLATLCSLLVSNATAGWKLVMTCERPPTFSAPAPLLTREVRALAGRAAESCLSGLPLPGDGSHTVLPLWAEHAQRLGPDSSPPPGMESLLALRIERLAPRERRVLEMIAIAGRATPKLLRGLGLDDDALEQTRVALERAGLVRASAGELGTSHPLIAHMARRLATQQRRAELHDVAARALAGDSARVELRAYHALRAPVDMATFVFVEDAVRRRERNEDLDGVLALLSRAVDVAQTAVVHGDADLAGPALAFFGSRLAATLLAAGRVDDAHAVVLDGLRAVDTREPRRTLLVDQLGCVVRARQGSGSRARASGRTGASSLPPPPTDSIVFARVVLDRERAATP